MDELTPEEEAQLDAIIESVFVDDIERAGELHWASVQANQGGE